MAALANLTAPTASLVNPFQYTARESDTETGLYDYRARYYDPGTGRVLNEDPARFAGGKNDYLYVSTSGRRRWDQFISLGPWDQTPRFYRRNQWTKRRKDNRIILSYGAGDGNRTHVRSLGSSRSATELRPLVVSDCTCELSVGPAFD